MVFEVDVLFNVGDQVMMRLRPARQTTILGMKGTHSKLTQKFYGPFPIVEKIGPVTYRLKLPEGARIHPVFHCSLLIPFHGAPTGGVAASARDRRRQSTPGDTTDHIGFTTCDGLPSIQMGGSGPMGLVVPRRHILGGLGPASF